MFKTDQEARPDYREMMHRKKAHLRVHLARAREEATRAKEASEDEMALWVQDLQSMGWTQQRILKAMGTQNPDRYRLLSDRALDLGGWGS